MDVHFPKNAMKISIDPYPNHLWAPSMMGSWESRGSKAPELQAGSPGSPELTKDAPKLARIVVGVSSPTEDYPLVNVYIAMENHHFQWENPLFLWSFSIANC